MNIQDLTLELGVNVNTNVMQPAPGDLLLIKVDQYLTAEQRDRFEAKLKPMFAALGCKMIVLEGGADVLLIKKATSATERQETAGETSGQRCDELQLVVS
ncbi:hypothetical protein PFLL34_02478 [Pseudomonas fluorescens]|uniref:hypothetical protein n=1 Tax=Pseudomonas fluorescens TaxID=294 RepID=UPI000762D45A|nr:hypothetical protein [Pseudomonas fluorescens]KWV81436.1 hypothetical protein PFLL34_02478 [Pseudomonas fluorescens]